MSEGIRCCSVIAMESRRGGQPQLALTWPWRSVEHGPPKPGHPTTPQKAGCPQVLLNKAGFCKPTNVQSSAVEIRATEALSKGDVAQSQRSGTDDTLTTVPDSACERCAVELGSTCRRSPEHARATWSQPALPDSSAPRDEDAGAATNGATEKQHGNSSD